MMASPSVVRLGALALVLALPAGSVVAATDAACMVAPTERKVVSSRFGIFRGGGAANSGGTARAHQHDGLDFSTSGVSKPVYSTTAGVITSIGPAGSAGNAIYIKRGSGDVVGYYHLSGFAPGMRRGVTVQPGQLLGLSGNTNAGGSVKRPPAGQKEMVVHLHFVYGKPSAGQQRSAAFADSVSSKDRSTFKPNQLPNLLSKSLNGLGWRTDPSPYFCESFRIDDSHPERAGVLGATTKAQYAILFGSVPPGGTPPNVAFDDVQVAAANAEAITAQADGMPVAFALNEGDGFGSLPQAPMGSYDSMSPREMMLTEAGRRFMSAEWNTKITEVSSRALFADFLYARGISLFLSEAIYNKKQRIEALLSVYTSIKLAPLKDSVKAAQEQAQRNALIRAIR